MKFEAREFSNFFLDIYTARKRKYSCVELDFYGKPRLLTTESVQKLRKVWYAYLEKRSDQIAKTKKLTGIFGDELVYLEILTSDLKSWVNFLTTFASNEKNLKINPIMFYFQKLKGGK